MAIEGVDYSVSRPSPAGLYAAGKRFAIRYLYGTAPGKAVTLAEIDALHKAGLAVVLNWEWQADEAKGGFATGADRARRTKSIVAELGAPTDTVVYFSVDYDATDVVPIRNYFHGITSVWPKNRTGIYGGRRVIDAARAEGWCPWYWQTYAWSGGVWVPGTHIQQYRNGVPVAGGEVDLDRAMTANYGQWRVEGDMTPEQAQQLEDIHFAVTQVPDAAGQRVPLQVALNTVLEYIENFAKTEAFRIEAIGQGRATVRDGKVKGEPVYPVVKLTELRDILARIEAALSMPAGGVTET
jgi:glycoside hydrolase-like protein